MLIITITCDLCHSSPSVNNYAPTGIPFVHVPHRQILAAQHSVCRLWFFPPWTSLCFPAMSRSECCFCLLCNNISLISLSIYLLKIIPSCPSPLQCLGLPYIYICVRVHVCMYTYIDIHAHRALLFQYILSNPATNTLLYQEFLFGTSSSSA